MFLSSSEEEWKQDGSSDSDESEPHASKLHASSSTSDCILQPQTAAFFVKHRVSKLLHFKDGDGWACRPCHAGDH